MKDWQEKTEYLLHLKDWDEIITVLSEAIMLHPTDCDPAVNIVYILHHILLEEHCDSEAQNTYEGLLKYHFVSSMAHFKNNSEYLFFIGKITHVAEWYFGLNDVNFALEMEKKAWDIEPDNLLYKWSYFFSTNNPDTIKIARDIVSSNVHYLKWLESKGFPGRYILGSLMWSLEASGI